MKEIYSNSYKDLDKRTKVKLRYLKSTGFQFCVVDNTSKVVQRVQLSSNKEDSLYPIALYSKELEKYACVLMIDDGIEIILIDANDFHVSKTHVYPKDVEGYMHVWDARIHGANLLSITAVSHTNLFLITISVTDPKLFSISDITNVFPKNTYEHNASSVLLDIIGQPYITCINTSVVPHIKNEYHYNPHSCNVSHQG